MPFFLFLMTLPCRFITLGIYEWAYWWEYKTEKKFAADRLNCFCQDLYWLKELYIVFKATTKTFNSASLMLAQNGKRHRWNNIYNAGLQATDSSTQTAHVAQQHDETHRHIFFILCCKMTARNESLTVIVEVFILCPPGITGLWRAHRKDPPLHNHDVQIVWFCTLSIMMSSYRFGESYHHYFCACLKKQGRKKKPNTGIFFLSLGMKWHFSCFAFICIFTKVLPCVLLSGGNGCRDEEVQSQELSMRVYKRRRSALPWWHRKPST